MLQLVTMVALKGHRTSQISLQIFAMSQISLQISLQIFPMFANICNVANIFANIFANICNVANIFANISDVANICKYLCKYFRCRKYICKYVCKYLRCLQIFAMSLISLQISLKIFAMSQISLQISLQIFAMSQILSHTLSDTLLHSLHICAGHFFISLKGLKVVWVPAFIPLTHRWVVGLSGSI